MNENGGWVLWDFRFGKERWAHERIGAEVDGRRVYADELVAGSDEGSC